ncbi:MAG TPA: hypothetical protein VFJ82_09145 [Longimicrobium sp.]|nr:hypothetical protein [Longimicrobium sp.]
MQPVGFSTGSLARGNVRQALEMLGPHRTGALELSALRMHELRPLLDSIPHLPLGSYRHVAVHAPSSFEAGDEQALAAALLPVAKRGWLVVVHPDTLRDFAAWREFGDRLCIENMDRRKPSGRTVEELRPVFERLPRASFCFDVAHARQCDTSMTEAYRLLSAFGDRLRQVHVSELDSESRHVRLTPTGIRSCREISDLIGVDVPVIIEAKVQPNELDAEILASLEALGRLAPISRAA